MKVIICDMFDPEVQDVRSVAIGPFQTEDLALIALNELALNESYVGGEVVSLVDSISQLGIGVRP